MDAYLAAALEEIERTVGPLDVATMTRTQEGRWSIAYIVEHLILAFNGTAVTLEKALVSGETRGRPPGLSQWIGRLLVIDIGYFPRAQAPERSRPSGSIPPERGAAAARAALTALDAVLARASERFGDTALVSNHPYFAGLTVPKWRKFHWRHTVHHMRQVRHRLNLEPLNLEPR